MRALSIVAALLVLAPSRARASEGGAKAGYVHAFSALSLGRGLRFNNPYRLETQLGDDPESLSLTASYLDIALGATGGDPHGFQHGAVGHLSIAIDGIAQEVGSLSYLLLRPVGRDFMLSVRGGIPVVLEPDLGAGLEIGAGATLLFTGGMGVTAELVSSLFFGAATWEADPTLFPIVSFQLGVYAEYEVLP